MDARNQTLCLLSKYLPTKPSLQPVFLAVPYPKEALNQGPPLDLGPANVLSDFSFDICKAGVLAGEGSLVLEDSGS